MEVQQSKFRPFSLCKDEDGEVRIVAGNVQVCAQTFKSFEDAETYLSTQPYEMFINLYSIFQYYEKENKKQN